MHDDLDTHELDAIADNSDGQSLSFPLGATATPVADVRYSESELGAQSAHYAYNVKIPDSDIEDFLIQTRASVLTKVRQKLKGLTAKKLPWAEGMLAIASATFGSAVSLFATAGKKPIPDTAWILSLVTVGSGVTFFFLRDRSSLAAKTVAEDVLELLPDPEKTSTTKRSGTQ